MRPKSILSIIVGLTMLGCACRTNNDNTPAGAYSGVVIYKSCGSTAVKVFNSDIGVDWLNCHDQTRYEHVVDLHISGNQTINNTLAVGQYISFDIVPTEAFGICKKIECAPDMKVSVVLR